NKKQKSFRYTMRKQLDSIAKNDPSVSNPNYDATLARKVGADDYGMKNYIWVILKTGPASTSNKTFVDSCFAGHMRNMNTMVKAGKLVVAGPMGKNDKAYRGIFILNVKDMEEAKKLLQTDPAVNAQLLEAELYNWYGSAALSEYLEAAEKVRKKNF
ncbi:MAG: YciI family protein, partial [Chitinophagaceae bacterium]|nr:YciI family protein [Chitinophagaceae bacterium]